VRTKSLASGRKGPGIFQPVRDVARLFCKGSVYSETTSVIFRISPAIYFASVVMACLVIPLGSRKGIISFDGDFIFFAYILALGKFFSIISAMDTGSSFEGMGASREALYSLFAEPAFFILIGSFALITGHTSFHEIFSELHPGSSITYTLAALAAFVIIMIAMIENSRMPIDDPKTHLELTMVHEVMILDNSGFDLGLILTTGYLKFAMYGAIIANLFTGMMDPVLSIPLFLLVQVLFAITAGLIESFMARFRMSHNPQFILALSSVSFIIFLGALLVLGKFI
jgi:formate hydrogenlyase subunit 4